MMSGFAPLRISPEKTGKIRERFLRFKKVILAVQAGIFQGGLLRNIIHHEGLVHPAGLPRERR